MISDPLIARLVAANPSPALEPRRAPSVRAARRPRARLVAVIVVVAIAVPAVAFADTISGLLGISNQGTTVATSDTPFSTYPDLNQAMEQLGLTTMQLLGQREGASFYAARNPDGHFCFAVASTHATGVGCRLDNTFPSPNDPLIDIFSTPAQIAGFAADNVATVALLDQTGNTLTTIPVTDNIYALSDPPAGATELEALDATGNVITSHAIPEKP